MATAENKPEPAPWKDFFVSYNRADRAWVEWISWQLEEAEYTTVLQAWDFSPGGKLRAGHATGGRISGAHDGDL